VRWWASWSSGERFMVRCGWIGRMECGKLLLEGLYFEFVWGVRGIYRWVSREYPGIVA